MRFEDSCVDVVGVNETFLRDSDSSRAVSIKGYKFIRNDRTVRGRTDVAGGGVGIYVRKGIKSKEIVGSAEVGVVPSNCAVWFNLSSAEHKHCLSHAAYR
jgi:hypothetical protein